MEIKTQNSMGNMLPLYGKKKKKGGCRITINMHICLYSQKDILAECTKTKDKKVKPIEVVWAPRRHFTFYVCLNYVYFICLKH